MKPLVRIGYANFFPGFSEELCRSHVLMDLTEEFEFVFDKEPDILLINCYSQKPVQSRNALKIGYYTENLPPDLENCDYFFGCEYTLLIGHPRYCKRVYGPLTLQTFEGCTDPEAEFAKKTKFCNFIYSRPVGHRERFFRALSQYKRIDAPGKSMNNCQDLTTSRDKADWQTAKIAYLRQFKFTIAFENSLRPGYATEKLYDAFAADTVPIYWGDPLLETIINVGSIVRVGGDLSREALSWLCLPERREALRPLTRTPTLPNKLAGRFNDLAAKLRNRWPYTKGFAEAVEEVRSLDNDDEAYCHKLAEPRVRREAVMRIRSEYFTFWRRIIGDALARKSTR